jgi:hypothetical protein
VRRRPFISTLVTLATLAVLIGACGGDDEGDDKPPAAPPPAQAPSGGGAPPPSAGQLPPEFIECMAAEGYEVESSADVHSAPPRVLQKCFGSLHGGGGAP